jgi:hypothetical protein
VSSRKTTADRLRTWLEARDKTRWRREVLLALPDVRAGAHSILELQDGSVDLLGRPCEVAIEQGIVLRQQGWTGAFRRCRSSPARLPRGL